jgi:hypothetical protein
VCSDEQPANSARTADRAARRRNFIGGVELDANCAPTVHELKRHREITPLAKLRKVFKRVLQVSCEPRPAIGGNLRRNSSCWIPRSLRQAKTPFRWPELQCIVAASGHYVPQSINHAVKNHHHNNPIHPKPPTHEDIALRAFTLWIDDGRPENCDEANWLDAEKQLSASKSTSPVSGLEPLMGDQIGN